MNEHDVNSFIGRKVRHFKGKEYLVLGVAEHTENGENVVVYKALYGECRTYVRPIEMFMGRVDAEKYPDVKQIWRMELIED